MSEGLKLKAEEAEDLVVLSATLEGAITSPGEMGYSTSSRAFTITASRFMWETVDEAQKKRIRTGLYCADVTAVKTSGISRDIPTMAMELLNISCVTKEDGTAEIPLNFAGGGTIRLFAECVNLTLTDVGDAWKTDHIPFHKEKETTSPSSS